MLKNKQSSGMTLKELLSHQEWDGEYSKKAFQQAVRRPIYWAEQYGSLWIGGCRVENDHLLIKLRCGKAPDGLTLEDLRDELTWSLDLATIPFITLINKPLLLKSEEAYCVILSIYDNEGQPTIDVEEIE
jgi:hypothetical protein